jgi:alkylhydroperoxidase/carboxymuconolactone decarboxylase family protein
MSNTYYEPSDLRKFGNITEWNEKALIALAVSHVVKCPYCIDAYTQDGLKRGITKEEMMEAVHAGAAIESGATLVHSVQMMNKYKKLSM